MHKREKKRRNIFTIKIRKSSVARNYNIKTLIQSYLSITGIYFCIKTRKRFLLI